MGIKVQTGELWICGRKVCQPYPYLPCFLTRLQTVSDPQVYPRGPNAAPLTMLTDTYTASAFFTDFKSDLPRALRWTTLRQDSGDPFKFVKQAKAVWEEVEQAAGLTAEEKKERIKRVIFSDGLDVETALGLQKGCDEIGIGGELVGLFIELDVRS